MVQTYDLFKNLKLRHFLKFIYLFLEITLYLFEIPISKLLWLIHHGRSLTLLQTEHINLVRFFSLKSETSNAFDFNIIKKEKNDSVYKIYSTAKTILYLA